MTKYKGAHYITLPENVSEINDYNMCKPLNRKGRVCSECMDGYGPAVMSVGFDIQCANCTGTWYGVPLFLFLELFPITVFYFIILIFQINITSGSITCYGPAVMSVGFDIQCANCTGTWYGVLLFLFLELFPITVFYFIILIFQINITSGSITCYGPAVMSVGFDIQCANCTGTWYGVLLFIFLELFPITIFYFIILIFQINITSGSITCYIMYSQLLIIGYDRIIAGDIFDITDILLTASNNSKLLLRFCSQSKISGIFVSFATSSHHLASVAG